MIITPEIVFELKTILWLKSLESYIKIASRNPESGTDGYMKIIKDYERYEPVLIT